MNFLFKTLLLLNRCQKMQNQFTFVVRQWRGKHRHFVGQSHQKLLNTA